MIRQPREWRRDRPGTDAHARDRRLLADGGSPDDEDHEEHPDAEPPGETDEDIVVMDPGEAEPAEPKWNPPDIDDIPDFEVRADEPVSADHETTDETADRDADGTPQTPGIGTNPDATPTDPTAGMPHDAQAPGATPVSSQESEAYIAALEICTRLPDDVRLPEEAADLVPAAVEAELEQDIQSFAAAEFDNHRPHVDVLAFEEVDGEIWLRIRIGLPAEGFSDLDPDAVRSYALQQLEDVF